jgi:hypothetical protein
MSRRFSTWVERHALFVAGLSAAAILLLSQSNKHLNQDGWLGLVGGREVSQNGIPQHDTLMLWTHGARWIDQQWLSQLGFYGLYTLGGLALLAIVYVILAVGSLGLAIAASRSLGAGEAQVVWVLPLAGFLFMAAAVEIRTQGFAYPLFAATIWLLASDDRRPRRRTYLVFPILILWANLHGTVALGVGITGLYGLVSAVRALRQERRLSADLWRALAFCIGPLLCLLVTPYGIDGLGYYRDTIFDSSFRAVITEWQPITSIWLVAIPFFVLAFACIWAFGRARGSVSAFDQLTLLALIAASISTIRNISWFALALLILLPPVLTATDPREEAERRPQLNRMVCGLAALTLLGTTIGVAVQPRTWFEKTYDQRTLRVVADAARRDPSLTIFSEGRFTDWLQWHLPELRGRMAYDARLELLTHHRLRQIADLSTVTGTSYAAAISGFRLLVLDPDGHPEATRAILRLRGVKPVFRGDKIIVATRSLP